MYNIQAIKVIVVDAGMICCCDSVALHAIACAACQKLLKYYLHRNLLLLRTKSLSAQRVPSIDAVFKTLIAKQPPILSFPATNSSTMEVSQGLCGGQN